MRWMAVAVGAFLAVAVIAILWGTALVDPPERVSRTLAVFSAVYPQRPVGVEVERIPCSPLEHLRLYVVCSEGCEDIWVIVGVRGLWPVNLANLARLPPQDPAESRARIAAAVAQEHLSLDREGAREMIGCYLRIDGMLPGLVLSPLDLVALEGARGSEEEMHRLAESLDAPDALTRIDPLAGPDGFRANLFYWDTSLPGRPVLEMTFELAPNGVLRFFDERESLRGGTVSDSSRDIPPS